MFFTFILPPIIFAAGYNLRRNTFFKYFSYIFLFGVCGTIITFCVVAPLTYFANKYDMFSFTVNALDKSVLENNITLQNYTGRNVSTKIELNLNISEQKIRHLYKIEEEVYTSENSHVLIENSDLNINESSLISDINKHDEQNENEKKISKNDEIIKEKNPEKEKDNRLHFSIKEVLLFASVISATDTVAALTFVKEESDPKLFAILFGEGVINDAVCIVLYRIIKEFTTSNEGKK